MLIIFVLKSNFVFLTSNRNSNELDRVKKDGFFSLEWLTNEKKKAMKES